MLKNKIGSLLVVAGLMGSASLFGVSANARETVDKVLAIVNSEPILQSEVDQFKTRLTKQGGIDDALLLDESIDSLKKDSKKQLDYLIREKLIESEVKKQKLEIGDDRLENEISTLAKRNHMTREQLLASLKKQGYSIEEYKENFKKRIERQSFFENEVISKLRITDEDAYNEFRQQNPKHVPSLNEFTIAQILFSNKTKSEKTPKERADAIEQKLAKGESFEKLADQFSEGHSTSSGGYLGVFKAGEFIPELEKAVQNLTAGQVSQPIQSKQGFHIIKVIDKKNSQDPSFLRVKEQLKSQLVEKNFKRQLKNWFESKKQDSYIKIN